MKKVLSAIALLTSLFLFSCKKEIPENQINVKIGGLLSLTGNWSTLGITSQEAMNIAVKDINSYMKHTESRYRFSTTVFDTKLNIAEAEAAVRKAYNSNIRYIVGPQSSAELSAIRSFANTHEILVVSQSSTAGSLAIAGDAIFRFCPGEIAEGSAMAKTIYASGCRALITVARNDEGNAGLQQTVGAAFTSLGGVVDAVAPYDPNITDFSSLLATIKSKIQQQSTLLGSSQVGVYYAAFDGAKDLFKQAAADPVLSSVHWYGGDGITLSSVVVSDATAASFAAATQFFAPTFGLPQQEHPDLAAIAVTIKNKTGLDADAYALAVYDAVWVIARTVAAFPEPERDFTKVKEVFQSEANHHFGITGPLILDTYGDRKTGSFDYWGIVNEHGIYAWKLVGKSL